MKKLFNVFVMLLVTVSLIACSTGGNGGENGNGGNKDNFTIAVVPKLTSVAWFQRMEVGINEWNKDNPDRNVDVFYTGPSEGDGAKQAQVIEDLISQGVDAIAVVPFSTEALEPVLKKAREQGIIVVTHEGAGMVNVDYDLEAFDNEEYGRHFMEMIGDRTNGEGEYIQLVGSLTTASHNQWVDAAKELQVKEFPDMILYGDKLESADSQDQAYQRTKEILTANPNIKAIQGSAMADVAGAALAIEEMGLQGKVKIIGTSLVSVSGKYVENGTIDTISFWDPALAGKAMVELSIALLNGEDIKDGLDLKVEGYNNLSLDGNVLLGAAWIDVNKDNVDDPAFDF